MNFRDYSNAEYNRLCQYVIQASLIAVKKLLSHILDFNNFEDMEDLYAHFESRSFNNACRLLNLIDLRLSLGV